MHVLVAGNTQDIVLYIQDDIQFYVQNIDHETCYLAAVAKSTWLTL